MTHNSVLIPWIEKDHLCRRSIYNYRGEVLTLSGCCSPSALICHFEDDIKDVGFLVSNVRTIYDLDQTTKVNKEWNC